MHSNRRPQVQRRSRTAILPDIDIQRDSSIPVYREAFSMARQTMFMYVFDIELIGCSLDRPWFSQSSGTRRRRSLSPSSTSRPHDFFSRFSSLFYRTQPTTSESIELQQSQRQHMHSHSSPRTVEVAPVRDKQALYVAPQQEQLSDRVKHIKNPTWWTRCILFICCVSIPSPDTVTDGHR
ncbi:hypothetical protein K503DRAFT_616012 [Rhizopogon vinicolor AM-OR11-026]|uniref:Uncharacterized protein n=1 Tax=Rhizopogon vinicolor AM-OR11-026 TaxID=1314800 RepID=A0A1B7MIE3_9AGAM|nr:hypothetical protein K503DRAFT_616012 [Rhizopogon vinicolor AM-OR11-026]